MSYLRCYEVLRLPPGASPARVHRAYKRLALRYHPDRTAGDSDSLARFCQVTEAYTILKKIFLLRSRSRSAERCPKCGRTAELFHGLGGRPQCAECLLQRRRRLLPLPKYETIRCIAAVALQGLALYCVALSAVAGDWHHGVAGGFFVIAAMGALACNVRTADAIVR